MIDQKTMTDREMLVLVYGAIKVTPNAPKEIVKLVEEHLFGAPTRTIVDYTAGMVPSVDHRNSQVMRNPNPV